jgi:hypothetical protein
MKYRDRLFTKSPNRDRRKKRYEIPRSLKKRCRITRSPINFSTKKRSPYEKKEERSHYIYITKSISLKPINLKLCEYHPQQHHQQLIQQNVEKQ